MIRLILRSLQAAILAGATVAAAPALASTGATGIWIACSAVWSDRVSRYTMCGPDHALVRVKTQRMAIWRGVSCGCSPGSPRLKSS